MIRTESASKSSAFSDAMRRVCPFCGSVNSKPGKPCPRCTLEDTPSTRTATKVRIGPWYVLQTRNPAAPGMKFQTLQLLIRKGLVTPQSVVRGPTTTQLWQSAAKVKGLSREFGLCYSCGGDIDSADTLCPHCNRAQSLPAEVDSLLDLPSALPASPPEEIITPTTAVVESPVEKPKAVTETVVAERPVHRPPSPDVLSTRELAMVFQLGYDAPTGVAPAIEKPVGVGLFKKVALSCVLLILSIGVVWWALRPGHVPQRLAKTPPIPEAPAIVEPAPHVVHLEAIAPSTAPAVPAATKSAIQSSPAEDVNALWNKALEAESHGDFSNAVKMYQQIKNMPSNVWPAGLLTRLQLARHELATGTY